MHIQTLVTILGSLQRAKRPPYKWTPNVANTNIKRISSTDTCKN